MQCLCSKGKFLKKTGTQGAQVFSKLSLVARGQKAGPKKLTKTKLVLEPTRAVLMK